MIIMQLPHQAFAISHSPSILQQDDTEEKKVFLPIVSNPGPRQLLLGVYTDGYLGFQSSIDEEVTAIGEWSGKKISIVGTFIAFEDVSPESNIPGPLGRIWDSGYTPFVNIDARVGLRDINAGKIDSEIRRMARAFKQWRDQGLAKNQNRKAFVAPFPEMNGDWVPYHGSPADFKTAYARIRNLFDEEGATSAVRWSFAPNGWSDPKSYQFEDYYPGDAVIEVNAFSGYNAGYCPSAAWKQWSSPQDVYGIYIDRMRAMAPSKPIFIGQTATSGYTRFGYSVPSKNAWLTDAYSYLANTYGIAGVIYFNKTINQDCDWSFYQPDGKKFDGYIQGVNRDEVIYIPPEVLANTTLHP